MNGNATINYKGATVSLKFAWPHIIEFEAAVLKNKDAHFQGDVMTNFGFARLLHTGYKNSCLLKDKQPTITLEEFSDWIDENSDNVEVQDEIAKVSLAWVESRCAKVWLDGLKKKTEDLKTKTEQLKTSKKSSKKSKPPSTPME